MIKSKASIAGSKDIIYKLGKINITLEFPKDFPFKTSKSFFSKKYHLNVGIRILYLDNK